MVASGFCQVSGLLKYMVVTFNEKEKRRSLGEKLRKFEKPEGNANTV